MVVVDNYHRGVMATECNCKFGPGHIVNFSENPHVDDNGDCISCATISRNGQFVIIGHYNGNVQIWDRWNMSREVKSYGYHHDSVKRAAVSWDLSRFVSMSQEFCVHVVGA